MAELNIIISAKNMASGVLRQVKGDLSGLSGAAGIANRGMSGLRTALGTGLVAGAAAGTAGVVAVGGAMVASTKQAADLEAQLSSIAAVMGLTNDETAPLKKLISDLAVDPTLKVSATEAADAVEMLAKNGLSMDDILNGAAKSTVLLANSAGGDFATSADVATDAIAQFQDSAGGFENVVNGVIGVVNNSKFGLNDYRLALAQAGGVAASVGVDFEDFNAAIAAISPLFGSGSDAGTSFKTFLQRLIPQTSDAEEAMRSLGLITEDGANKFFDAEGNLRSMSEIAGLLQGSLSGLSEEQRNQALQTIFGTDAMRAAVGLAQTGGAAFEELGTKIAATDAAGAAATRMDNLSGAIEIARSVIQGISIQIGDAFLPTITAMTRAFTTFVSENKDQIIGFFTDFAQKIQDAIEFGGQLVTAISTWGFAGLFTEFEDGSSYLSTFLQTLGMAKDTADSVSSTIQTLTGWIQSLIQPIIDATANIVLPHSTRQNEY